MYEVGDKVLLDYKGRQVVAEVGGILDSGDRLALEFDSGPGETTFTISSVAKVQPYKKGPGKAEKGSVDEEALRLIIREEVIRLLKNRDFTVRVDEIIE